MDYLNKGYSILPCGKNKIPLIKWTELQTRYASEDEVLGWIKKFPEMNIGIITGNISGIICLDFDVGHDKETNPDIFPETLTFQTPSGGIHKIFKYVEGYTVSANAYEAYPYMDVRSDTGLFVAPPSITSYKDKDGNQKGGEYKVLKDLPIAPFPVDMFPKNKIKRELSSTIGVTSGERNSSLASIIGKLLLSELDEDKWITEVLPAIQQINKTYIPILSDKEVLSVFNSIVKKEKIRRSNSSIEIDGQEIKLSRSRSQIPFMNMANVVAILEAHPDFRSKIRYNRFTQEIEIDGKAIQDEDTIKIQHALQTKFGLSTIANETVYSALVHCSYSNSYDEAQDWLTSLKWDGERRLFSWLATATHVEDNEYHRGIGTQWFLGMVNRIMNPGCIFDYMLVLVGGQGIGKTSLFRELGGKWYKSFIGGIEGKDFYMQMRGGIIMDLDEGATLYKSEAIKIKSIITTTHDEFRAPYDRIPKKYPRHFVFSMSTNDVEPFRDATGNRRYWPVDLPNQMVNFDFIVNQREQLFAEALYWLRNPGDEIPQVPAEEALLIQEQHLPDDSWTELVLDEVRKSNDYCTGSPNFSTTIMEVFKNIFPQESMVRLDRKHELRIGNIFRKKLGLERRREMIEGERKNRWYIMPSKIIQLQASKLQVYKSNMDKMVEEGDEF